jgi:hypothetical protein
VRLPADFYTAVLPRLALGLGGLVLVLVALIYWLWTRPRRLLRERRLRGRLGEEQAAALLERAGYRVLASQHAGSFTALVDGEAWTFALRADYLVRGRDGLYLAEVKTGEVAPRLQHGPTRRQLLEYSLAFRDHISGVLLVAPEHGEITRVSFPDLHGLRRRPWPAIALGAGLGAGLLYLLQKLSPLLR